MTQTSQENGPFPSGGKGSVFREKKYNILFYLRRDAFSNSGGDLVEARNLRGALEDLGHHADIGDLRETVRTDHDIVHLFNIDRAAELLEMLHTLDLPAKTRMVLTPNMAGPSRSPLVERAITSMRSVANSARTSQKIGASWNAAFAIEKLRRRVDGLIFHTENERRGFNKTFRSWTQPSVVIPPAVTLATPDPNFNGQLAKLRPFVAVVGRIEPLKNQIWIMKSGIDQLCNVLFVGKANPKRPLYFQRFRRLLHSHPSCTWLGKLNPDQVTTVLHHASCHILASRHENFGLVSVEALMAGCPAAIPQGHYAEETLNPLVRTFSLRDPNSLVEIVRQSLSGSGSVAIEDLELFHPDQVARRTLSFYSQLPARQPHRD